MRFFQIVDVRFFCISVLLHVCAFSFFIFQFPQKFNAHKPGFIFLGSILKANETSASPAGFSGPAQSVPDIAIKYMAVEQPYPSANVTKPEEGGNISNQERLWLKSTFEMKNPSATKATKRLSQDLGIDLEAPVYQPLRIHHDSR